MTNLVVEANRTAEAMCTPSRFAKFPLEDQHTKLEPTPQLLSATRTLHSRAKYDAVAHTILGSTDSIIGRLVLQARYLTKRNRKQPEGHKKGADDT